LELIVGMYHFFLSVTNLCLNKTVWMKLLLSVFRELVTVESRKDTYVGNFAI
jgi:hypothetical protein